MASDAWALQEQLPAGGRDTLCSCWLTHRGSPGPGGRHSIFGRLSGGKFIAGWKNMKEADKDEERALFHPVVQAKTRQHYKQLANGIRESRPATGQFRFQLGSLCASTINGVLFVQALASPRPRV